MLPDLIPDAELLRRTAAGEADAFETLYQRRQGEVFRFALHMTASRSVAEDVAQETFLAVMRDAGRYDPARATVGAWLCGIARNHVRRRLDRDRRLSPAAPESDDVWDESLESATAAEAEDPLATLARAERVEAVREAILALPVRYREAVVLCDLEELSYADAAGTLGCALGTVRSRLHRGRSLLAERLLGRETKRPEPERAIDVGRAGRTLRTLA
jgi:RNA polymerase sigma-70 factor (ECF subfamily)